MERVARSDLMTAPEAAAYLGIRHQHLRALIVQGRIRPTMRGVGRRWLLSRDACDAYAAMYRTDRTERIHRTRLINTGRGEKKETCE